jgi:hypothetical protein
MKKFIWITTVIIVIAVTLFLVFGDTFKDGEKQLLSCISESCSEKESEKAVSLYFRDLRKDKNIGVHLMDYETQMSLDVDHDQQKATVNLTYVPETYQSVTEDIDQLYIIYNRIIPHLKEIDTEYDIDLSVRYFYQIQSITYDIVLEIPSDQDALLLIVRLSSDTDPFEYMVNRSSHILFHYIEPNDFKPAEIIIETNRVLFTIRNITNENRLEMGILDGDLNNQRPGLLEIIKQSFYELSNEAYEIDIID